MRTLSPGEVLDELGRLHDRLARPSQLWLDYLQWYGQHSRTKGLEATFWPYKPSREPGKLAGALSVNLFGAECYQVTAEIVAIISEIYQNSQGLTGHLEQAELPADAGFAWLDEPVLMTDVHGKRSTHRAISWRVISFPPGPTGAAIRLTTWSHIEDPDDYSETMDEKLAGLGPLAMLHSTIIPFAQQLPVGMTEQGYDSSFGWVHALWMFMGTEIAAAQRPQIHRNFARRAMRSVKQNQVNVVLLRRAAHHEGGGEHREIDWKCCWLVQGHGRHLEGYDGPHHRAILDAGRRHCLTCGARATYVSPYVKGPDNMPLKASRLVFRVSR